MTITVAALIGLIFGLTTGVIVAGLALMEHPRRWVVCVRLPEELHRRLSEDATDHMCSPQSGNHQSLAGELPPTEWGCTTIVDVGNVALEK